MTAAVVSGQPEDQLRGPSEVYLSALGQLAGAAPTGLVFVGESMASALQVPSGLRGPVRRDAGEPRGAQGPRQGRHPRRFTDAHDWDHWVKLQALPNLLYSDIVRDYSAE